MVLAAQPEDTAVVYVAHRSKERLETLGFFASVPWCSRSELAPLSKRSAPLVALCAEPTSLAPERGWSKALYPLPMHVHCICIAFAERLKEVLGVFKAISCCLPP